MTSYTASVTVDDGMLHTARPITAPDAVKDMIDSVVYAVVAGEAGEVLSVELTVETAGESDTPIADSISGTSSQPLPDDSTAAEDPAEDPAPAADAAATPQVQA